MDQECIIQKMKAEVEDAGDWKIQFELDLTSAFALAGNLQLALRHPMNVGPSSRVARSLVDDLHAGLEERGFIAHAEALRLGDDPTHDYTPTDPKQRRLSLVNAPVRHEHETEDTDLDEYFDPRTCRFCGEEADDCTCGDDKSPPR